jgi:hypothetical protein
MDVEDAVAALCDIDEDRDSKEKTTWKLIRANGR